MNGRKGKSTRRYLSFPYAPLDSHQDKVAHILIEVHIGRSYADFLKSLLNQRIFVAANIRTFSWSLYASSAERASIAEISRKISSFVVTYL